MRFASALATVNEEKRRKKEGKTRNIPISSHTARALCPDSEIMREKRIERERKRYGQRMKKKEKKRKNRRMREIALFRMKGFTS